MNTEENELKELSAPDGSKAAIREKMADYPFFVRAMEQVLPSSFAGTDAELLVRLGVKNTPKFRSMRILFWDEYKKSTEEDRLMRIDNVLRGVSLAEFKLTIKDPDLLAYLIRPMPDDSIIMREIYHRGMERISEIMSLPIREVKYKRVKNTKPGVRGKKGEESWELRPEHVTNVQLAKLIVEVTRDMSDRLFGSAVQRQQILQHTITENKKGDGFVEEDMEDLREMEKRLATLNSQLARLSPPVKDESIIDAEVEDTKPEVSTETSDDDYALFEDGG